MNYLLRAVVALATLAALLTPSTASAKDDFQLLYFPHEDVASRFGDDWGDARSGGRSHQGTDIMAEKHSNVLAIADGFVVKLGNNVRSGFYVRLTHQDGWDSYYMHLNNDTPGTDDGAGGPEFAFAPGLAEGDFVRAGTVIGFVGDSGNAEGSSSHTHFELHSNGRAINPYNYVNDAHARWLRFMELCGVAQ